MTIRRILLVTLLATSACTVGPNYKAPEPAAPAAFAGPQPLSDPGGVDLARWWTAFDDPELQRLIEIGLKQAPDLQTAASKVRQARLQVIEARSAGLPDIGASGSGQYTRLKQIGSNDIPDLARSIGGNQQQAGGAQAQNFQTPKDYKTVSAGFDASWEIDLFGGVRRQVEAAKAQAEGAEWQARDARVSLAAEIAADYYQMRSYQAQARIAQAEADRQARSLSILEHTAQAGLVPQGNATRQRTQLATARAQIDPLKAQALTQIDALAVLVGEAPETLIPELNTERALPALPPALPPGTPIDLIRRRPDVRAAERQLAATTANIGVAVADMYPKVSLSAMPQLGMFWLGGFFLGKSLQLTAQGSASFPIFDFGRRRAEVESRREDREQAYIQWRQAVIGALRDVEDALVRLEGEKRSNAALRDGLTAAERSLGTTTAQFKVGLQDYTPVLDAQQQLLQMQTNLAQSDARLRADTASLYKALGGGWSEKDAAPERPTIEDGTKGKGSR
jgi:outer membrane protein, multidrug efflux system